MKGGTDRSNAGDAERLGRADQEMPDGTLIHVDGVGQGKYVGFKRNRVGANDHTISFNGNEKVLKLKKKTWHVVKENLVNPVGESTTERVNTPRGGESSDSNTYNWIDAIDSIREKELFWKTLPEYFRLERDPIEQKENERLLQDVEMFYQEMYVKPVEVFETDPRKLFSLIRYLTTVGKLIQKKKKKISRGDPMSDLLRKMERDFRKIRRLSLSKISDLCSVSSSNTCSRDLKTDKEHTLINSPELRAYLQKAIFEKSMEFLRQHFPKLDDAELEGALTAADGIAREALKNLRDNDRREKAAKIVPTLIEDKKDELTSKLQKNEELDKGTIVRLKEEIGSFGKITGFVRGSTGNEYELDSLVQGVGGFEVEESVTLTSDKLEVHYPPEDWVTEQINAHYGK